MHKWCCFPKLSQRARAQLPKGWGGGLCWDHTLSSSCYCCLRRLSWWIIECIIDEVIRFIGGRLRQGTRLWRSRSFLWEKRCYQVRRERNRAFRTVWFFNHLFDIIGLRIHLFALCRSAPWCGGSPGLILRPSILERNINLKVLLSIRFHSVTRLKWPGFIYSGRFS